MLPQRPQNKMKSHKLADQCRCNTILKGISQSNWGNSRISRTSCGELVTNTSPVRIQLSGRGRCYVSAPLRVPTHRIRNAPAVLLDGCYAFIALIIPFLGLFYQGTLTEYLSRNPFTNSGVKLIKMDGLTEPLV